MVCIALSPIDVQNLIFAELWLEKWGISSSDSKVQASGLEAALNSLKNPGSLRAFSSNNLLYSTDNTPNSIDWEMASRMSLGDLSLMSFTNTFESEPTTPAAGLPLPREPLGPHQHGQLQSQEKQPPPQQQQQEEEGYSCAGYTTLESFSVSGRTWSGGEGGGEGGGKMEQEEGTEGEATDRKVQESCQWTSHLGI